MTSMSALSEASTPAQDAAAPSIEQLQQHNQLGADLQGAQQLPGGPSAQSADSSRKRACPACPAVGLAVAAAASRI